MICSATSECHLSIWNRTVSIDWASYIFHFMIVNFDWTGQCSSGALETFQRAWSTHNYIRYCLLISIIAGNDNCIRALVFAFQTKSREILWKPTILFSCTSITCHEYLVDLISLSLVARSHKESMHHQKSNKLRNYLCINQSDQSVQNQWLIFRVSRKLLQQCVIARTDKFHSTK